MVYVLDSDHLSLFQRGYEPLKKRLLTLSLEQISITIVGAEELLRGRLAQVRRAAQSDARVRAYYWLSETLDFLCSFPILKYDSHAEAYFQTFLDRKIRIGTQDLKIAAIVLSQQATLVTRNRRDFECIPSLEVEDWSI